MQEGWEKSWTTPLPIPPVSIWALWGLLAVGVVAFLAGLLVDPARAWQAYLVNFLFWGGLAQGGVVFAAVYHVVEARWGPPVRRLAEGMSAFLPVSLVLFFPLFFGLDLFFGRIHELNPDRGAWFDPRFIFVRGGLGLASMTVLSLLLVYYSLRPEVGFALERGLRPRRWVYGWLAEGWQGDLVEIQRGQRGMDVAAAGVLLAYPITYSFMAFDLIMALDPFWYSSLFGGYFFVSTFYLGLAGLAVVAVLTRQHLGIHAITTSQFSDLGKLLFGFNLTYMAMLWSQYLVIWYGNLPEETHFLVLRLWERPWALLSWSVLVATFFLPFLVFLSRRAKQIPWIMLSVGMLIAAGLWLERYVLVVPSLWHGEGVPFGWLELGVTAGFLGAAGLSYLFFFQNFPVLPLVRDPASPVVSHPGEKAVEETPSRA
ncbi:MAG: hypothetical protein ACE5I9_02870 [Candidatus Methylomirabilales bacterium]